MATEAYGHQRGPCLAVVTTCNEQSVTLAIEGRLPLCASSARNAAEALQRPGQGLRSSYLAPRVVAGQDGASAANSPGGNCQLPSPARDSPSDVSMACGERKLLPLLRAAPADTLVLADGFSCRTQIAHGSDRLG